MYLEQKIDRILELLEKDTAATPGPPRRARAASKPEAPSVPSVDEAAPSVTIAQPATLPEVDPFVGVPVVTVTIDEVRAAAIALSKATTQDNAVNVMKAATGASSFGELKAESYPAALAAFTAALPKADAVDPFGVAVLPGTVGTALASPQQVDAPTLAQVKKAVIDAQKITGTDVVQKVIMAHGGVATKSGGGGQEPSLKAIPISAYATVIEALGRLTKTK